MMFAMTTTDGWRPGIGDPTFMGWFTVFAYLATSFLCWKSARAALPRWKQTGNTGPVFFWILFSALLLLLGINKQLDLQTWFSEFVRDMAKEQGWYEQRQIVQIIFIVLFTLGGLAAVGFFIRLTLGAIRDCRVALLGGIFLISFVVMRAASFHHVDNLLVMRLVGVKMNWLFELGGIACIAWGAVSYVRHPKRNVTFSAAGKKAQRA